MDFSLDEFKAKFEANAYIDESMKYSETTSTAKTPVVVNLFNIEVYSEPQLKDDRASYYLRANRATSEALAASCYLAIRVTCTAQQDMTKLMRSLHDCNGTSKLGLTWGGDASITWKALADTSYGADSDFKSYAGCVVTAGYEITLLKSGKQMLNTTPHIEVELVSVTYNGGEISYSRTTIRGHGNVLRATTIRGDIISTTAFVNKDESHSQRKRRVGKHFCLTRDSIDQWEIAMEYLSIADIIADILTKAQSGGLPGGLRSRSMKQTTKSNSTFLDKTDTPE